MGDSVDVDTMDSKYSSKWSANRDMASWIAAQHAFQLSCISRMWQGLTEYLGCEEFLNVTGICSMFQEYQVVC